MATAAIYCTHKELKRVFPQLDSFDNKKTNLWLDRSYK